MKSRRKGLARLLVALLIFLVLGAVYLETGLFPGRLREAAMNEFGLWTHKKVVFDKALFIPFHGLSFYRVRVLEQNGREIFRAQRITLNARLAPFLQEKKIMVNRFLLEEPIFNWILEGSGRKETRTAPKTVLSGQIDVPVVPGSKTLDLQSAANGPDFFLPENVTIERIEISNGHVTVRRDRNSEPMETLSSINVRMTLPKGPMLGFEGHVVLGRTPYASVNLNGAWDLESGRYQFTLRTLTQKIPNWLLDYQKDHFLRLRDGRVSLETHLYSGETSTMLFKTKAALENAVVDLEPAFYSGKMRLEAEGVFDALSKRFKNYRGQLDLVDVSVSGPPHHVPQLDHLVGVLSFEPDNLLIRSLRGTYKKAAFDATGSIRSFNDLILNGEIRSDLTMDQMMSLLEPKHAEKIKDFVITGNFQTLTVLSGSLRKDSRIGSEHKVVIRNVSISNNKKNLHWTQGSAEVTLDREGVRVQNGHFLVSGKPAALSVFIPKEPGSEGDLHLRMGELDVRTAYLVRGDDLALKNGEAVFSGSRATFNGTCVHWTDPWLELRGEIHVDLSKVLPPVPLSGVLSGPFVLSGAWDKPLDWDLKIDAEGAPIRIQNTFLIDKLQLQIRVKDRRLEVPYLHGNVYGGTLSSQSSFGLSPANIAFRGQLALNNLDLSKLGGDLTPPREDLRGTLIGKLSLEGQWLAPETYRGDGAVSIIQGFLGQTTQFKAMGHLPLLKVEGLDVVTFEALSADFQVHDKKVHTQDLTLLGDSVDLSLRGTIGFDESLDMAMSIQYSDAVIQGARLTGGLAPLVVQQAEKYISERHVGGTVKAPVIEKTSTRQGER